MFSYPPYIVQQMKGGQINRSQSKPVYISLLKNERGFTLCDVRLWINGEPTGAGVYVQDKETALNLIKGLQDYVNGLEREKQDSFRSITEVLGYNPFEEE